MILEKRTQKEKEKYANIKKSGKKTNYTVVEEILRQTLSLNMQIETKREQIFYWENIATQANAVFSTVNTGGTRKNRSKVEECVCKIVDMQDSLEKDMNRLVGLTEKVTRIIEKMDIPEYKSLLTHRYLCGKTWCEVADSMGYSYVHTVNRLHPKALKRISEIWIGADN